MSTALATISRGKNDEVGNIVDHNICAPRTCIDAHRVAEEALPMERGSLNGRFGDSLKYDIDLATKFPIIDLNSVLGMRHNKKVEGVHPPKFAVYNAIGDGTCKVVLGITHTQATVGFENFWPREAGAAYAKYATQQYSNRGNRWAKKGFIIGSIVFLALPIWLALSFGQAWLWLLLASPVVGGGVAGICDAISKDTGTQTLTLTAYFKGLIPEKTRAKIKSLATSFEHILVVQEAEKWESEVTYDRPPRVPIDPLVVGQKLGCFYLLDRFDTTTLEEYVSREFCTDESPDGIVADQE